MWLLLCRTCIHVKACDYIRDDEQYTRTSPQMRQPFKSVSDDGSPLFLCTAHGPLTESAFYPSDLRFRRRCCRDCVRRRVSKHRGGFANPCPLRRSLVAFKTRARRYGNLEAIDWELKDVELLLKRACLSNYCTLRIHTPAAGVKWVPSNCEIQAV